MFNLTGINILKGKLSPSLWDKTTMIRFYLPACCRCLQSQSTYIELDNHVGGKYNIAQLDCSLYLMVAYQISGFRMKEVPTFAIFKNGEFKYKYTGNITIKDMMSALDST